MLVRSSRLYLLRTEKINHRWVNIAREKMTQKDLEEYRCNLNILDTICNYPGDINLDNCDFDIQEEMV